jgi:hypothetical protein
VRLPFADLGQGRWQLTDLMGDATYDRGGDDLQARGLFLDVHSVRRAGPWRTRRMVEWYEGQAEFLNAGPPVVCTIGTAVADVAAAGFFERCAASARALGRRAVLILKEAHNRPRELPEGVAAFTYAPFSERFPRAAVIIHHGGIGTTGLAMRPGRPMLAMPCAWDQPDNAAGGPAGERPRDSPAPLHPGPRCRRAAPAARRPDVHTAGVGGRHSRAARGRDAGCV